MDETGLAKSRLRLAVFTSQAPWGKSESFVLTEIAELRRRVEAILVIPVRPRSALFHGELARRVGQYAIRLPVVSPMILICATVAFFRSPGRVARALMEVIKGSSGLSVLMKNLVVYPKAVYVARLVRRFGAHHIHAYWASVPATMALVVSRLTGVPWSFTAHRWDVAENNLLWTKVRAAQFARVISNAGRNEILRIIRKQDWPTLLTLHMGVALPDDPALPIVRSKPSFSIGCVANLLEVKGHRYLIEACALLQQRGHHFVCNIIGHGPLRKDLERRVREYGLQGFVKFWGPLPHEEVIGTLRRREIDLMVLPSIKTATGEHEGIPVALMEALAFRIPVVSTSTGAISELISDGAGVLVKPADAKALADAIERVLVDSAYQSLLAERGFERVSSAFALDTAIDRLLSLMQ